MMVNPAYIMTKAIDKIGEYKKSIDKAILSYESAKQLLRLLNPSIRILY